MRVYPGQVVPQICGVVHFYANSLRSPTWKWHDNSVASNLAGHQEEHSLGTHRHTHTPQPGKESTVPPTPQCSLEAWRICTSVLFRIQGVRQAHFAKGSQNLGAQPRTAHSPFPIHCQPGCSERRSQTEPLLLLFLLSSLSAQGRLLFCPFQACLAAEVSSAGICSPTRRGGSKNQEPLTAGKFRGLSSLHHPQMGQSPRRAATKNTVPFKGTLIPIQIFGLKMLPCLSCQRT